MNEKVKDANADPGKDRGDVIPGNDFILAEYAGLSSYFERTLEEREITLKYYFQTVTAPAAIVVSAATFKLHPQAGGGIEGKPGDQRVAPTRIIDISDNAIGMILLVIFLVGILALFKYHLEVQNGRHIAARLNKIRRAQIAHFGTLRGVIRTEESALPFYLGIGQYGSAMVSAINAAIFIAALHFITGLSRYTNDQLFALYGVLFFSQLGIAAVLAMARKCEQERQQATSR